MAYPDRSGIEGVISRGNVAVRIGLVCQVRNEADVLPAFLSHVAALVDHAVLMDHGSIDNSHALLAAACVGRAGWSAWRVALPGHHQPAFGAFAARHLFDAGTDRVIFLDADEFLDIGSRAMLMEVLAPVQAADLAGYWHWHDAVPERLDGILGHADPIWTAPARSSQKKAVLNRAMFERSGRQAGPSMGAHAIDRPGGPVRWAPLGTILHLPFRSPEQMRRKAVVGWLSELARSDRAPYDGSHWAGALARVARGALTEDDVRGFACRYGAPYEVAAPMSLEDLAAAGWTRQPLAVAHAVMPASVNFASPIEPWQVMADALLAWAAQATAGLDLELVGDILRQKR